MGREAIVGDLKPNLLAVQSPFNYFACDCMRSIVAFSAAKVSRA
jgi:hypothetical protein